MSDAVSLATKSERIRLYCSVYGPDHRPFIYFEVIDMGGGSIRANHYSWMGRVSEFLYGKLLSEVVTKKNGQKMKHLRTFGTGELFLILSLSLFLMPTVY